MNILTNNRALEISGIDAENFLQGQLSNDISKLDYKSAQISALCQHQGKIIALFTIVKNKDNNFYLIMPEDIIDIALNRLSMFIIMSDVQIKISAYDIIGVLGSGGQYKLNNELSYDLKKEHNFEVNNVWKATCIENKIPEIYPQTSEKFVPQMLNLDIDELGVNFTKGCYTGQEVVARLHYLGKAKRRLFKFNSSFEVNIGDKLIVDNSTSQRASGIVINVVKLSAFYQFIATLEVDKTNEQITINNKKINFKE